MHEIRGSSRRRQLSFNCGNSRLQRDYLLPMCLASRRRRLPHDPTKGKVGSCGIEPAADRGGYFDPTPRLRSICRPLVVTLQGDEAGSVGRRFPNVLKSSVKPGPRRSHFAQPGTKASDNARIGNRRQKCLTRFRRRVNILSAQRILGVRGREFVKSRRRRPVQSRNVLKRPTKHRRILATINSRGPMLAVRAPISERSDVEHLVARVEILRLD